MPSAIPVVAAGLFTRTWLSGQGMVEVNTARCRHTSAQTLAILFAYVRVALSHGVTALYAIPHAKGACAYEHIKVHQASSDDPACLLQLGLSACSNQKRSQCCCT